MDADFHADPAARATVAGQAVFGLAGWHNAGKTTLLVDLVRGLTARGLTVSTVKHAHHAFDVDQPGKDSYRHRTAGAHEVLVASARRWALMHELRHAPEPDLATLLRRLAPVNLVLVEGFKQAAIPKLEIFRPPAGEAMPMAADDPDIVAIAAPAGTQVPAAGDRPVFDLADPPAIVAFIVDYCGLEAAGHVAR